MGHGSSSQASTKDNTSSAGGSQTTSSSKHSAKTTAAQLSEEKIREFGRYNPSDFPVFVVTAKIIMLMSAQWGNERSSS